MFNLSKKKKDKRNFSHISPEKEVRCNKQAVIIPALLFKLKFKGNH